LRTIRIIRTHRAIRAIEGNAPPIPPSHPPSVRPVGVGGGLYCVTSVCLCVWDSGAILPGRERIAACGTYWGSGQTWSWGSGYWRHRWWDGRGFGSDERHETTGADEASGRV